MNSEKIRAMWGDGNIQLPRSTGTNNLLEAAGMNKSGGIVVSQSSNFPGGIANNYENNTPLPSSYSEPVLRKD